jgi:hypothetical protein
MQTRTRQVSWLQRALGCRGVGGRRARRRTCPRRRLPRSPGTAMLIPCYRVTFTASHNDREHIYINKPAKRVSHRADSAVGHAHQPRGTLPNACAPGSVPHSLLPHDRPSSSFGHVAHGCDTAQPVAAQWRRRPRRTRRRQPRSRACPPPCRRRCGPAGPPHNEESPDGGAQPMTTVVQHRLRGRRANRVPCRAG